MKQKITGAFFGLVLLAAPILVSADTLSDFMDQTRFQLFRAAASQAQYDPAKPTCVMLVSTTTVALHEPFIFAWGAWGVQDSGLKKNKWSPTGAFVLALDKPGKYTYKFKFYGAQDTETSCQTVITVK